MPEVQIALLLLQFGLKYGPEAVQSISTLINNKALTIADVQAAFTGLKPYSAYGIPDVATLPPV